MGWFSSKTKDILKAAKSGDLAAVEQALADGADINTKSWLGESALSLAARNGHLETVRRLLAAGANPREFDNRMLSPLMEAASRAHPAIVRELIHAGADPNELNSDGKNAFIAMLPSLPLTPDPRHAEVLRELIAGGLDIHNEDQAGCLPLVSAASHGTEEMVRALLDAGADVNARDAGGSTALMIAAAHDRFDLIRILAAAGADLNARATERIRLEKRMGHAKILELGEIGELTALMIAALGGRQNAALVLIEAGADPDLKASDGSTAYDLAAMGFHVLTAAAMEEAIKAQTTDPQIPAA